MVILTVHWDLLLLWEVLTITAKFYFICLMATAAYSTYFLARIALRLRQLLKHKASSETHRELFRVTEVRKRIENLRRFHTLLFLLFGVCCANEAFATIQAIKRSAQSLSAVGIEAFEPFTAFVFAVFLVFVFLHVFQWTVAARLQSSSGTRFNQIS